MRNAFAIALVAAGAGLACPAFAADAVVARVNGAEITSGAVSGMMSRLKAGKGHGAESSRGTDALRKEALDRLIFEELACQEAKADGVRADPREVDQRLEDMRTRMGGEEGLRKALEKENRTEEGLRAAIERDIVLRRIVAREVPDNVVVPEEDIAREYEREKGEFVIPEKVVVDDVVIFLNPGERASVERAGEIRRKVLEDKDRNPWNLEPDGTFIVHETEIHRGKQEELYREAVKLKPGELSGVIETEDSLHIVRLKEYTPMKQLDLDQVRGFIARKLKAEARQKRLRQWEADLRKNATIEIMDVSERKP